MGDEGSSCEGEDHCGIRAEVKQMRGPFRQVAEGREAKDKSSRKVERCVESDLIPWPCQMVNLGDLNIWQ